MSAKIPRDPCYSYPTEGQYFIPYRKVLSKTSKSSQGSSECQSEQNIQEEMTTETTDSLFTQEIDVLKSQIEELTQALSGLQSDLERKDLVIAKLAREKEKISLDLIKQKRSNCNIIQQLEDERNYYFKEKEIYCQEMNEMKRLKKNLSTSSLGGEGKDHVIEEYKVTIAKLKDSLNQTLEANYNLSIKFLRMKNTKTCLKTELKRLQMDHDKIVIDMKSKIEKLSAETEHLAKNKMCVNISPSSKKYLQLVKQNSCLIYENLSLQLEVDRLSLKLDKQILNTARAEKNSMLQYIKHSESDNDTEECSERTKSKKRQKRVRIKGEVPAKLAIEKKKSKRKESTRDTEVVKIFEREVLPGIPNIQILNESGITENATGYAKPTNATNFPENQKNINKLTRIMEDSNEERLTLLQVSELQSQTSTDMNDCSSTADIIGKSVSARHSN